MKIYLNLLIFLVCTSFFPLQPGTPEDFLEKVKHISERDCMQPGLLSVVVSDTQTGKVLVDFNGKKSLATASTMKVITTATALMVLGKDFRYVTQVGRTGKVQSGTLNGDLVIKGSGDPTLGAADFEGLLRRWTQQVKASGITQISGNIVADASIFPSQAVPDTWAWEDIGNYYASGVFGINVHENLYRLHFKPGNEGRLATVTGTAPTVPNIEFVNEMQTGAIGSGDQGYIFGTPYSNLRYLRGSIPAGKKTFSIKGSIPDPPYFLAWHLKEALKKAGISVKGTVKTCRAAQLETCYTTNGFETLFEETSAKLEDIVKTTNHESNNTYAEALFRTIALRLTEKSSNEAACRAVMDYWKKVGIDSPGMHLEDGSGLSRFNELTAWQMTEILIAIYRSDVKSPFELSLPVAGRSGTLKRVGVGGMAAGRIRAKSGYTQGVRAYCGYARTLKGKVLAFSIMANNHDCSYGEMSHAVDELFHDLVLLP